MELFRLFFGDISFLEKMSTLSFGGGGGGRAPKTWTGFLKEDVERLKTLGSGFASQEMGMELGKIRPKLTEVGEKHETYQYWETQPDGRSVLKTATRATGRPEKELVGKEEAAGEITRLMGLFRKRQQEVVRQKAAPGRKALLGQQGGNYGG